MPTFVTFEKRAYYNHDILIYGVWNYEEISSVYVKGFKNGFITIEAFEGTPIKAFAEFVAGIFHPQSNFANSVCDMYDISDDLFKGVKFNFNDVNLTVTKENADAKRIYEEWKKKMKMLHN